MSFADLGISKPVVNALAKRGITEPFAVQEMVVTDALDGHDLLVQSPTGSGKTLAFGIPMVDVIEPSRDNLSALVLAPTRELASQIVDELSSICRAKDLKIAAVYGGVGFGPQIAAVRRADIVVATPGRLEDLLARGVAKLDRVQMLVLDEADRMLDMGFKPAVSRIVGQTPDDRQTLFFSATLEGATGKLAAAYTHKARTHTNKPALDSKADIEHSFVHVDSPGAKFEQLTTQLRDAERGRTLVFVRTKRGADRLVKRLRSKELEAVAMHGDKSQSQRERALARFERGDVDDPDRDRRGRPRHRRRRSHPRDQLRRPRRPGLLHPPDRPHRPRRLPRRRHQLHPLRPGRRDGPHRPRPRPQRRVRTRAPEQERQRIG